MIVIKHYQRLKDLREDKELNQNDNAKVLETSQNQYSRWEREEQELAMHNFIKLAKFYDVSLDYIAGLTNKKHSYKEWE